MQRYPSYTVSTNIYTRKFAGVPGWISLLYPLYKMHPSVVQALVVDDKATRFITQQLQHVVRRIHEHEDIPAIQVLLHAVVHDSTQHIEVLPHVRRLRVKPELGTVSQAEHGYRLFKIVYTIAGVNPPWMRMSVPAIVRSSILIQFSAAGSALDFPRAPGYVVDAITAGGIPPATGTNPSGMVSRAYFFFHQKYWWEGMPFSSKTFLMEIPFSRLSAWISSICSRVSI